MSRKQFTPDHIEFAVRPAESGSSVAEVIEKLGVSEQTFYCWNEQFAGLAIAEL